MGPMVRLTNRVSRRWQFNAYYLRENAQKGDAVSLRYIVTLGNPEDGSVSVDMSGDADERGRPIKGPRSRPNVCHLPGDAWSAPYRATKHDQVFAAPVVVMTRKQFEEEVFPETFMGEAGTNYVALMTMVEAGHIQLERLGDWTKAPLASPGGREDLLEEIGVLREQQGEQVFADALASVGLKALRKNARAENLTAIRNYLQMGGGVPPEAGDG